MKAAALFGMVLAVARTAYVQSAAPSCIVWKAASEGTHSPPGTFFAGLQGKGDFTSLSSPPFTFPPQIPCAGS